MISVLKISMSILIFHPTYSTWSLSCSIKSDQRCFASFFTLNSSIYLEKTSYVRYYCNVMLKKMSNTHTHTLSHPLERPCGVCLCSNVSHKAQQFNVSRFLSQLSIWLSHFSHLPDVNFLKKESKQQTVCSMQYWNSHMQTHKTSSCAGVELTYRLCFYGNSRLPPESLVFFQLSSF